LQDAIDDAFCEVVRNDDFQFGARDIGGLISYPSVHFLSGMFKSHSLYLVEGEKLDSQLGDASVDVIKARGANDGFDFFHFFQGRRGLVENRMENKLIIYRKSKK